MSKKKRVIGILVVVCMMTVIVFGAVGTGAWFRDRAVAQSGSVLAGTLDMTVDGSNAATAVPISVRADKFAPGKGAFIGSFKVKNIGNIDGTLKAEFANKVDAENTITPPETMFGDTTAAGELSSQISVYVTTQDLGTGSVNIPYVTVPAGSPSRGFWYIDPNVRTSLNAGVEKTIYVYAYWPADGDADNLAQGDSVTFDINLVLTQIGAGAGY